MTFLQSTSRTLGRLFENTGRSRARRELLSLNDRSLVDAGFSRTLLESGNAAWPWRIEPGEPLDPLALSRPLTKSSVVTGTPVSAPLATATADEHDELTETMRKVA